MFDISRHGYKVMLDHRLFVDRKEAAASFCRDLHARHRWTKRHWLA